MERNKQASVPAQSITDPAAEEAHRHLSWTPEEQEAADSEVTMAGDPVFEGPGDFVSYTGFPDGTFEVTYTMQRGDTVAVQSERSVGERQDQIRDALFKAYEKADRALTVLAETGR